MTDTQRVTDERLAQLYSGLGPSKQEVRDLIDTIAELRAEVERLKSGRREPDDFFEKQWRKAGGNFHGPRVETGCMEKAKLIPFLRLIYSVGWGSGAGAASERVALQEAGREAAESALATANAKIEKLKAALRDVEEGLVFRTDHQHLLDALRDATEDAPHG